MTTTYLGIDLGTSGLKLALVRGDGAVVAEAEEAYAVRTPLPRHAETDPRDWTAALDAAVSRLAGPTETSDRLTAVSLAGQMHGTVLADAAGVPLRPAMLWPDRRAADQVERWQALAPAVRGRLGNPLAAGMAGPLLAWLAAHQPDTLERAAAALSPKDWLRHALTGTLHTERSDASATLLWDVTTDTWCPEAVALAGLSDAQLPAVVDSDAVAGETSRFRSLADAPVPVVVGAADTAAALLALQAADVVPTDAVVVNAGTGIQVLRPGATPGPRPDPVTHLYADASGGWYEMLAVQNGGLALTWALEVLDLRWDDAVARAGTAARGSAGVVFMPFLTGERGGVAPPGATGRWSGLTTSATRSDLVRAAFEGYAFTVRRAFELLDDAGSGDVVLSGGGGRDPWVRRLLADVLDRPVAAVSLRSASATGAAVLAARGVGHQLPVRARVERVEPRGGADGRALAAAYDRWLGEVTSLG